MKGKRVEGSSSQSAGTPSKRIRKSLNEREIVEHIDEEEDEPFSQSQIQNDFISTLKQSGVKFTKPMLTVPDPMAVRKELSKKFLTKEFAQESQLVMEFVQAFKSTIEDETELKRFLLPFKR
jgi:hypothetical protein